jgi:SUN domain-containing protein 1/2
MSQLGVNGAPTPRRSARISHAGSATGQSVVTTVTNGGTRQPKTARPLSKIKPRKSNAYGASGRVGVAEEISISTTSFAQAFQNQRGNAVARDDDEEEDDIDELGAQTPLTSGGLRSHVSYRSPSLEFETHARGQQRQSFEESEDITPSEDGLATSIMDTTKSFGLGHEAGMLSKSLRQKSSTYSREGKFEDTTPLWQRNQIRHRQLKAQALTQAQNDEDESTSVQPTPSVRAAIEDSVDELIAEERNHVQRDSSPQPRPNAGPRQRNISEALNAWLGNVEPGLADEREWSWKKALMWGFWLSCGAIVLYSTLQYTIRSDFPESSPNHPSMAASVATRISYEWSRLAQAILPPTGPTVEDEVKAFKAGDDNIMWNRLWKLDKKFDAKIDDMHHTIEQLKNDLPETMVIRRHKDGRREVTDEFWNALIGKARSKEDDPAWTSYLKESDAKLRELFGASRDVTDANHWPEAVSRQEFIETVDRHYESISTRVDEKIFAAIKGQATEIKAIVREEARKAMVDSVRLQSLAQSNLLVNYEASLAKPNYFSSGLGARIVPSLTSATYLDNPRLLAKWLAYTPHRNPPKAALEKWDEPGDCWCSAPNPPKHGHAQLVVALPRAMYPNQVTIEHLPMSAMPAKKITTAPRHMELWVESDEPIVHQGCQEGPGAGWICLGSFKYDIHAFNHQQSFDLDTEIPTPITTAMLRVVNNWGADHTCLYRVRLHGRDAEQDYHYDESVLPGF